jgi:hypothetical protein
MGRVVHGASCPWGELSVGRTVCGGNCPLGRTVRGANCPWGELSVGRIARGANCPWGRPLGSLEYEGVFHSGISDNVDTVMHIEGVGGGRGVVIP